VALGAFLMQIFVQGAWASSRRTSRILSPDEIPASTPA
jgi:hypothetical protein